MKKNMIAIVAGVLFGLGLSISQMVNPEKVLAFLDIFGSWDPSLLLVLGAAVSVTAFAFSFIASKAKPLLGPKFDFADNSDIDYKLLVGAAIFGVGWGLAGYCPGPAITSLAFFRSEAVVFVLSMAIGAKISKKAFSMRQAKR